MAGRGVHWVVDPNEVLPPKFEGDGFGARPAKTVIDVLKETVSRHGDKRAMGLKRPVNVSEDSFHNFMFLCKLPNCVGHHAS
jgi:hypothetical protein